MSPYKIITRQTCHVYVFVSALTHSLWVAACYKCRLHLSNKICLIGSHFPSNLNLFFNSGSMMANQSNVPSMMPWWSWPLSVLSVTIPRWIIMRLVVKSYSMLCINVIMMFLIALFGPTKCKYFVFSTCQCECLIIACQFNL